MLFDLRDKEPRPGDDAWLKMEPYKRRAILDQRKERYARKRQRRRKFTHFGEGLGAVLAVSFVVFWFCLAILVGLAAAAIAGDVVGLWDAVSFV